MESSTQIYRFCLIWFSSKGNLIHFLMDWTSFNMVFRFQTEDCSLELSLGSNVETAAGMGPKLILFSLFDLYSFILLHCLFLETNLFLPFIIILRKMFHDKSIRVTVLVIYYKRRSVICICTPQVLIPFVHRH